MSRITVPNNITAYITDAGGKDHYLPAQCSFTHSTAWDTKERRATDSTNTIQSISVMTKRGRQPATIQLSFVLTKAFDESDLYDSLAEYEALIGQNVELIYSNRSFGRCIVENGSFSMSTDYTLGATSLTISLNLKESIIYTPSKKTSAIVFQ